MIVQMMGVSVIGLHVVMLVARIHLMAMLHLQRNTRSKPVDERDRDYQKAVEDAAHYSIHCIAKHVQQLNSANLRNLPVTSCESSQVSLS